MSIIDNEFFAIVKIALGLDPDEALPEENRELIDEEWQRGCEILDILIR